MKNNVSDINQESALSRLVRTHGLVVMMFLFMVLLAGLSFISGVVVGDNSAAMRELSADYEAAQRAHEIEAAWKNHLIGALERHNIEVPEPETE